MIDLTVFAAGTAVFAFSLFLHVIVWRFFRPSRQLVWLITLFLILPAALFLAAASPAGKCSPIPASTRLLFAYIWNLALSLAYILTYPPIQTGCPSLNIIAAVYSSGAEGMTEEEILKIFSQDSLFSQRLYDLVGDGLVSLNSEDAGITRAGRGLAAFFSGYRRLLGLPKGEG